MKKVIGLLAATAMLFGFGAMYTNASAGGALLNKMIETMNGVKAEVADGNSAIQKTVADQQKASKENGEEVLTAFYQLIAAGSKKDVAKYQQEYLSRLADIQDILGERNFKEFTEQKKKDVSFEITQDVKEYLGELLDN